MSNLLKTTAFYFLIAFFTLFCSLSFSVENEKQGVKGYPPIHVKLFDSKYGGAKKGVIGSFFDRTIRMPVLQVRKKVAKVLPFLGRKTGSTEKNRLESAFSAFQSQEDINRYNIRDSLPLSFNDPQNKGVNKGPLTLANNDSFPAKPDYLRSIDMKKLLQSRTPEKVARAVWDSKQTKANQTRIPCLPCDNLPRVQNSGAMGVQSADEIIDKGPSALAASYLFPLSKNSSFKGRSGKRPTPLSDISPRVKATQASQSYQDNNSLRLSRRALARYQTMQERDRSRFLEEEGEHQEKDPLGSQEELIPMPLINPLSLQNQANYKRVYPPLINVDDSESFKLFINCLGYEIGKYKKPGTLYGKINEGCFDDIHSVVFTSSERFLFQSISETLLFDSLVLDLPCLQFFTQLSGELADLKYEDYQVNHAAITQQISPDSFFVAINNLIDIVAQDRSYILVRYRDLKGQEHAYNIPTRVMKNYLEWLIVGHIFAENSEEVRENKLSQMIILVLLNWINSDKSKSL